MLSTKILEKDNSPKIIVQPLKKVSPKEEPAATVTSTTKVESAPKETKPIATSGTNTSEATTTATLGKTKKNTKNR